MAHFVPCSKALTSADLAGIFVKEIFRLHGLPADMSPILSLSLSLNFGLPLIKNFQALITLKQMVKPKELMLHWNNICDAFPTAYKQIGYNSNWVQLLPYLVAPPSHHPG
jgi:hypothetical protein